MENPVAIVFDIGRDGDVGNLPETITQTTALADSIATLSAKYLYPYSGVYPAHDGLDIVQQYMALPLAQLRGLGVYLDIYEYTREGILADSLRAGAGWHCLRRLTLYLDRTTAALSLESFYAALHNMPALTCLTLDCAPWLIPPSDMTQLRAPPCQLRSFTTRFLFPGCGILLRNSSDTLHTLVLEAARLSYGPNRGLETPYGPLIFRALRNLDIYYRLDNDITPLVTACPRLERLRIMDSTNSEDFEAFISPALEALESPLQFLQLSISTYRFESLPRFIRLVERPDSPLRNLRTVVCNIQGFDYDVPEFDYRKSPLFRTLAARRVAQYIGPNPYRTYVFHDL